MIGATITDREFERLRDFFQGASGIRLGDSKKVLVCGRLSKRLRHLGLRSYRDYLDVIESAGAPEERALAIDLLTTNETHFFREPRHFDLLREQLTQRPAPAGGWRVWSAACSSGEEPYSIAMVLADVLGERPWSVFASDLSLQVLDQARRGLYGPSRRPEVPRTHFERFCLEGTDEYDGQFLIDRKLRQRVTFAQINLMQPLPAGEPFDLVFLRNVLIYFDTPAKRRIVEAIAPRLRPGGLLLVGHSETLGGVTDVLEPVATTVYRRRA
jgi:chemotaxis protein methyltransferase CheR